MVFSALSDKCCVSITRSLVSFASAAFVLFSQRFGYIYGVYPDRHDL